MWIKVITRACLFAILFPHNLALATPPIDPNEDYFNRAVCTSGQNVKVFPAGCSNLPNGQIILSQTRVDNFDDYNDWLYLRFSFVSPSVHPNIELGFSEMRCSNEAGRVIWGWSRTRKAYQGQGISRQIYDCSYQHINSQPRLLTVHSLWDEDNAVAFAKALKTCNGNVSEAVKLVPDWRSTAKHGWEVSVLNLPEIVDPNTPLPDKFRVSYTRAPCATNSGSINPCKPKSFAMASDALICATMSPDERHAVASSGFVNAVMPRPFPVPAQGISLMRTALSLTPQWCREANEPVLDKVESCIPDVVKDPMGAAMQRLPGTTRLLSAPAEAMYYFFGRPVDLYLYGEDKYDRGNNPPIMIKGMPRDCMM